ncbi:hypothetical protein LWC35_29270 [Pseudonocardia kujensis]|uniref:hypothetical protein n=1 Tax=Pseudonocardia kujensis TaxID=1128675 RepID=UPI001E536203|nr:hypothetical protein [Pseudonocardia kujensis]MCE0766967.1 hypothetical protein [Pseudonocardia kujensis]
MSADRPIVLGVLVYVVIAAAPTLLIWAVARFLPVLLGLPDLLHRLFRRAGPPRATGQSFESLVADLHRLRREVCGRQPTTHVRRVALMAAYDDVLHDLCRAVGVARPPLCEVPERERPFARLQTEAAIEAAGVVLDPPGRGSTAA